MSIEFSQDSITASCDHGHGMSISNRPKDWIENDIARRRVHGGCHCFVSTEKLAFGWSSVLLLLLVVSGSIFGQSKNQPVPQWHPNEQQSANSSSTTESCQQIWPTIVHTYWQTKALSFQQPILVYFLCNITPKQHSMRSIAWMQQIPCLHRPILVQLSSSLLYCAVSS